MVTKERWRFIAWAGMMGAATHIVLDLFVTHPSASPMKMWLTCGASMAVALLRFPTYGRVRARFAAHGCAQECEGTGALTAGSDVDAAELALTSPSFLGESERIELAGRICMRLVEAGDVKRAYLVLRDSIRAAYESRPRIARVFWLTEFRAEKRALAQVSDRTRLVEPGLGITGELMIALFHALDWRRFDDHELEAPSTLAGLQALLDPKASGRLSPQSRVLSSVLRVLQHDETHEDVEGLVAALDAGIAPTFAYLGCSRIHQPEGELGDLVAAALERAPALVRDTARTLAPPDLDRRSGYRG